MLRTTFLTLVSYHSQNSKLS